MPADTLAVILAAGAGTRLRPLTEDRPKCLLEAGGRALLDYQLDALAANDVREVLVVTGFCAEQIVERYGTRVRALYDSEYETTNNLHSLWTARRELAGRDVLCLHADVLFHPAILPPCLEAEHDVTAVLDRALVEETMKARVEEHRVVEIGKRIPPAKQFGTFLGIARFAPAASTALVDALEKLVEDEAHRQSYFVACLPLLARQGLQIGYSLTEGLAWIEIDTLEDLQSSGDTLRRMAAEGGQGS
ncbi:MAG: NTP transferase domain-containing protein [Candidatus Acidiferrales bacterium]